MVAPSYLVVQATKPVSEVEEGFGTATVGKFAFDWV
jgi:hypothetical protein